MNFLSGLLILFFTSFAVVRGTSMLVSGKMRRRFAKGYEMLNEGILVRVLGLILILLGRFCFSFLFHLFMKNMGLICKKRDKFGRQYSS